MKFYTLAIFISIYSLTLFKVNAQQEPVYTLYRYNTSFFNPAAIGLDENVVLKSNSRISFVGINEAPDDQSFYITTPINEKISVGVNAILDQVFIETTTSLFASVSYNLQLNDETKLIFGIQAGGSFTNINFNRINLPSDPLFAESIDNFNPNIGVGFYLDNNRFFASLSSPRLLSTDRVDDTDGVLTSANNDFQIYLSGGYHIDINREVKFTPSTLVRYFDGETTVDITGTFKFLDRIEVGANFRVNQAFGGLLYLTLSNWLEIGYAYENNTSDINTLENGTHEFGITFKL